MVFGASLGILIALGVRRNVLDLLKGGLIFLIFQNLMIGSQIWIFMKSEVLVAISLGLGPMDLPKVDLTDS